MHEWYIYSKHFPVHLVRHGGLQGLQVLLLRNKLDQKCFYCRTSDLMLELGKQKMIDNYQSLLTEMNVKIWCRSHMWDQKMGNLKLQIAMQAPFRSQRMILAGILESRQVSLFSWLPVGSFLLYCQTLCTGEFPSNVAQFQAEKTKLKWHQTWLKQM